MKNYPRICKSALLQIDKKTNQPKKENWQFQEEKIRKFKDRKLQIDNKNEMIANFGNYWENANENHSEIPF